MSNPENTPVYDAEYLNDIQKKVKESVFYHSCISGAIALFPFPLVGEAAVLFNQLAMYRNINKFSDFNFTDNVVKNIGKFLLSQLAGAGVGAAVIIGVTATTKFIPGVNFLAAIIQAPLSGIVTYTCGIAYYRMLEKVLKSGSSAFSSEEDAIKTLRSHALSPDELKNINKEAKLQMNNVNYSKFKAEAQTYVDEAKCNSEI